MTESTQKSDSSSFEPSPDFLMRQKRLDDALNLRKPDRIPVAPLVVTFYPTRAKGISNKDAMHHPEKTYKIWKETTIKHDWDAAPPATALLPARPLEIMGVKQFKWPGGGLKEDRPFQWVEGEYMMQDEYDEMLANPNEFSIKKLWPRISSTLAPIAGMIQTPPPPLVFLSNAYTLPGFIAGMVSASPVRELLEKALELADENEKINLHAMAYSREMMNLGYPVLYTPATFPAFDWISDTLRGLRGALIDMYQAPDKLMATIEMFIPLTIGGVVAWAEQTGSNGVFIAMHRGAAGFMSDEQFAKFYWPCFKALVLGLIEAGLTPIPLFEGDYTPRLKYLQELPPKKILGHFDRIDRKKAKKMIGDVMCFWGNVPASIMCTGTPQQVKEDVKELIDIFGDNGGLIIDSTMGIPDESREENVQALKDAVHEYGVR